ncbi:hypothetical protein [Ruminococcus sp. zg-924]|uniref:hypothetical protein n=1 Tax=Ruminococcus sp. zg-924 TaxID=2678505 RepID=UPI00210C23B5|nr:hypothetical protein [Ruminococcus sp. zg-924]MCQ4022865.1 hypothetical protein [Ruminococcus sp. zg-924]
MEIADVNDLIIVGIPTDIILTAGIPANNAVNFSAKKGVIIIEDTGMTAEEMAQSDCDCICDERREKLEKESEDV